MKYFLALLLSAFTALGANIDYRALQTGDFGTDNLFVTTTTWTNSAGQMTLKTNVPIFVDYLTGGPISIGAEFNIDPLTTVAATNKNTYALAGFNSVPPLAATGVENNNSGQVGVAGGSVLYGSTTNGIVAGVIGLSERAHSTGIGVVGTSFGQAGTTNVGTLGSAQGGDRTVGGYFETISAKTSANRNYVGSAILADTQDTTNRLFVGRTNGSTEVFKIDKAGDLIQIKSVTYSWPTANGSANSALIDQNGSGSLIWSNIPALVTNNQARIGPGTNNFLAKFNVVGGTNVGNSPLFSSTTNSYELMQAFDGSSWTNSGTNRMYGEYTNAGTNQWLEIIVPKGHNNEAMHIRHNAIGQTSQRAPIYMNDSWYFEPNTNFLSGHASGRFAPLADNSYDVGTSSAQVKDFYIAGQIVWNNTPSSPSLTRVGGYGLDIQPGDLSFYRDTGITAGFNKTKGQFVFDLAGNYIGFGTGASNCVTWIGGAGTSLPIGYLQIGTNSGVAAPTANGIIGSQAIGTDKGGSDILVSGGVSTGLGTNGNVRLLTTEKALATGSSLNTGLKDRLFIIADPITITTNAATIVLNMTIPTALKGAGGQVVAHTEIENGVDIATLDETFMISANRKGSTVVAGTPSAPITATSTSGGSAGIVNTWTLVANAQSVDLKVTCVTAGINSTNSTCRVTFIPNSSAVPVITHP